MKHSSRSSYAAFDRDVSSNGGYLYTRGASLSSCLANRRLTEAVLDNLDLAGKKVLDIGCGDGTYTLELFDRGRPASLTGIDPADEAVRAARQKVGGRNMIFATGRAEELPYRDNEFDLAHLRGVLHHVDDPAKVIKEALRVARKIIIIEPNGCNPVLKLIERVSPYHREHGERSYLPLTFDKWVRQAGGKIITQRALGLVPFFCPDFAAKMLKAVEPAVEQIPLVRTFVCAVNVFVAARD